MRMREQTGCAGVMIARGSFGQPWIFDQARALLDGPADAPDAAGRGALRDRARPRAHGAGVRGGSARRGDRVPKAPRLVREGAARLGRAAPAALRGDQRSARSRGSSATTSRTGSATPRATARDGDDDEPTRSRRHDGVRRERVRWRCSSRSRTVGADVDAALDSLAQEPVESLGFATIDHHRALRQGYPEVIFGAGQDARADRRDRERIADRGDGVPRHARGRRRRWPRCSRALPGRRAQRARAHGVPAGGAAAAGRARDGR